jgi:hypothetical protein
MQNGGPRVTAKKKEQLWFGYIEAGERSSPVVRDASIETGKSSTIYLYNAVKGRILEYQRDIVEPKLRELIDGETANIDELRKAYRRVRESFIPRAIARPKARPVKKKPPVEPDLPEFDDDEAWKPDDDEAPESFDEDDEDDGE